LFTYKSVPVIFEPPFTTDVVQSLLLTALSLSLSAITYQ